MMVATTREFAGVNEEVRAAELRLNSELARPDLAALLRKVQEGEKDKLRFTLIQQVLFSTSCTCYSLSSASFEQ